MFFDGEQLVEIPGPRHPEPGGARFGLHALLGSGGAAGLGRRAAAAARMAKALAARAVRDGLTEIGAGAGPVNVLGHGTKRTRRSHCPRRA